MLTVDEVQALLRSEKDNTIGVNSAKLADERRDALDYYMGDMSRDMPAPDGQSSAVSMDVSDTIEGIMPPLMEVFTAGDKTVEFDPVGLEDVEAAEQETDYVNHVFSQKNPGFMVLYSFIKDALMSKVGIVKVYWEKEERQERETYRGQPADVVAVLLSDPDVELVSREDYTIDGPPGPDGMPTPYPVSDITLVTKKTYGCAKVIPVPPEEFGISKRARTLKDAHYCYHQPHGVTESDLISQGYDEEQIKNLPTYEGNESSEQVTRNQGEGEEGSEANTAMRPVQLTEHYVRMAYENDAPELYRVTTGGDKMEVLRRKEKKEDKYKPDIIPADVHPFATMTPIIMTHRFFGRSIADLVMDIQRIKTALLRALLNNAYLANNQRIEVATSYAHERTLDDLLSNRPGGVVRTQQPGGLLPIPNQPIGSFAFPLVEYLDGTREWRTGVTRQGQGMDANALQNQSATAANELFRAAQARIKLIARIFAETGVKDLYALLHQVIRKNDTQINTVRLRGKWVRVNPRGWKTRHDMTINVGLGTGTDQEQIGYLTNLLGIQQQMMMAKAPTVTFKNVYNTVEALAKKMKMKAEPYFTDPDSPQGKQIAQAASQAPPPPEMQVKMMELQAKQGEIAGKMEIEKLQAQADIASQERKVQSEIVLAEKRFELEKELKIIDAQLKTREHEQKMVMTKQQASYKMQEQEMGTARAAVDIKHSAGEIAEPLTRAMAEFADHLGKMQADQSTHLGNMQEAHANMLSEMIRKPRKTTIVRGKDNRPSHSISEVI